MKSRRCSRWSAGGRSRRSGGSGAELGQLLDAINSNGARLLGDRRIGKTSLLGKLEVELRAVSHTVIRVSAETTDPTPFRAGWSMACASRAIRAQWGRWEQEFGGELSVKVAQVGFVLTGKTTSPAAPAASERDLVELLDEVTGRQGPHLPDDHHHRRGDGARAGPRRGLGTRRGVVLAQSSGAAAEAPSGGDGAGWLRGAAPRGARRVGGERSGGG